MTVTHVLPGAVTIVLPLALGYGLVVLLLLRHRRREAHRLTSFERHRESVRLPESWLDRRERETRTLTEVDDA